eukprot:TRINITY_DN9404_c0_g1_i1.p1 TRINITY_DN9404_c0_g1~~TRINITY_DN9404_c0_g1_i1.p1  ORF type:complete len:289 (-),score=32.64 TRINITY_DN9404_c0_g1_i1:146-1012(-)
MVFPQENQNVGGVPLFALAVTVVCGGPGIFLTSGNFVYKTVQGEVIDYDELLTGLRREAQLANIMQFVNWFGSITSANMPLVVMSALGYDQSSVIQPRQYRLGVGLILASNAAFCLVGIVALYFYPITKDKYEAVLAGIELHKSGQPAVDPFHTASHRCPQHGHQGAKRHQVDAVHLQQLRAPFVALPRARRPPAAARLRTGVICRCGGWHRRHLESVPRGLRLLRLRLPVRAHHGDVRRITAGNDAKLRASEDFGRSNRGLPRPQGETETARIARHQQLFLMSWCSS